MFFAYYRLDVLTQLVAFVDAILDDDVQGSGGPSNHDQNSFKQRSSLDQRDLVIDGQESLATR